MTAGMPHSSALAYFLPSGLYATRWVASLRTKRSLTCTEACRGSDAPHTRERERESHTRERARRGAETTPGCRQCRRRAGDGRGRRRQIRSCRRARLQRKAMARRSTVRTAKRRGLLASRASETVSLTHPTHSDWSVGEVAAERVPLVVLHAALQPAVCGARHRRGQLQRSVAPQRHQNHI